MRHLGQVGGNGRAIDTLTEADTQLVIDPPEFFGVHYVAQANQRCFRVRHFDADVTFAGDRRFNTNRTGCQRQRQVRVEFSDLPNLDFDLLALSRVQVTRLNAELRDDRTGVDFDDIAGSTEGCQGFFDNPRTLLQDFIVDLLLRA